MSVSPVPSAASATGGLSSASLALPAQFVIAARVREAAIANVGAATQDALRPLLARAFLSGRKIAIAVGSRGIDRLAEVVRAVVGAVRARGGEPFVLPAMGSHGGATADGQAGVLAALGVTEDSVGAPVRAAMDVNDLGPGPDGAPVLLSREAVGADGIILVNRVKPHTDFASERVGSGLLKMAVIGLGKAEGAFATHRRAARVGHERALLEQARAVLARVPIIGGVALIEDGRHRLARIEALPAAAIEEREPALLREARAFMPGLPFREIDVLVVDQIGKDISGAGLDPNVTGRGVDGCPRPDRRAEVRAIYVRGLTPATHGNAIGLGLADVVASRVVEEMDRDSVYVNALSAMVPATARIPMHFPTDEACLRAALRVAGVDAADARIVRIRNTLALDRMVVSAAYEREIADRSDLTVVAGPAPWGWDLFVTPPLPLAGEVAAAGGGRG